MEVNLNDVSLFTRVLSKGTFTAAAKSLGVQVSVVSRRVAKLEEQLGTRLLHRTTRKLSLTDAGRIYHSMVVPGLEQLEAAAAALRDLQVEPSGRVRFTTVTGMSRFAWELIEDFMRQYPRVTVEMELTEAMVDLVGGEFDVALRTGNLADSSLITRRVAQVRSALFAAPEYVSGCGAPESPEDLAKHECLIPGPSSSGVRWDLSCGRKHRQVAVSGRLATTSMETIRHACLAGFGVGYLPIEMCQPLVDEGLLVRVLPEWAGRVHGLFVVYPSRQHISPSVRAFIDHLSAHASDAITRSVQLPT